MAANITTWEQKLNDYWTKVEELEKDLLNLELLKSVEVLEVKAIDANNKEVKIRFIEAFPLPAAALDAIKKELTQKRERFLQKIEKL